MPKGVQPTSFKESKQNSSCDLFLDEIVSEMTEENGK